MSVPAAGQGGDDDPHQAADRTDSTTVAGPPNGGAGRHPRKRHRVRTALLVALVAVLLVAGLGVVAARVTVERYDRAVARDVLLDPNARATTSGPAIKGPLNFLLIGSDRRASNPGMGQRSDTIIVAHVSENLDKAYLISIPRDLLVRIPPMPEQGFPGATAKINAAFEYGHGGRQGIQLLARTLTGLTGVRFDGAAVLDFTGLRTAVKTLGGVRMCVDVRTVSIHTGAVFEKGCRRMGANQVLDYLRQRETLPDGDFGRQRHQQQFIKALVAEAGRQNLLLHPLTLDRLIRGVASAMVVDVGTASLPDLLFALRGIRPQDVTGIRVPTYDDMIDNISYVVPREPLAPSLFAAVRTDTLAAWTTANRQWVNRI
jgi:LCP family protein required for cell wall assembly